MFTLHLIERFSLPQFSAAPGKNEHTEGSKDGIKLPTKSHFAMSMGVPHMYVVTLKLTYLPICQARIHAEEDQVALVT